MALTVGYMLTWRTYGTWAAGDARGQTGLARYCREQMKGNAVRLDGRATKLVHEAIAQEAKRWGEKIEALAVRSDHVHVVVRYGGQPIDEFVSACKAAGRLALKGEGFEGKVWAKGYDKRFCFDESAMETRIGYVEEHDE